MEKLKSIINDCHERNKWIARSILTIILLLYLWAAFPGYGFHTWYTSSTSSTRYITTETLSSSVLTEQYFSPLLPYLKSIHFAAKFETESVPEESVIFTLCNENGEVLFSQDIPITDMKSKRYYEVEINKRLKTGNVYYWSLTSPMSDAFDWQIMYTEYPEDQAPENTLFLVNHNPYGSAESQTISQYTYYDHHDKVVIISGFWASGFFVYLIALEIINRIFKSSNKSN